MTTAVKSPTSHTAHFYRDEGILCGTIAEFFAEGARQGDSLVMISRRETFTAVSDRLDGTSTIAGDQDGILFIDAKTALGDFMDNGRPDPVRFQQAITRLLAQARSNPERRVRMFGEMVDLLCGEGNHEGTVRLEDLWNGIASIHGPVSVLCGYSIGNFENDPNAVRYHAICRQHSHIIPAEPGPLNGDLPAHLQAVEGHSDGAIPILKEEPSRRDRFRQAGSTIYIIEDDDSVRRSLARLLGSMNLKVQTFESAEGFLSQIGESPSGCVIVDVQLVGMSGAELQSRLAEARCLLPVIAMSGSHDPKIEIEVLRLGAKAFLSKPFNLQNLLAAIDQAMG
jgi:CheY-like chemotaxis protein